MTDPERGEEPLSRTIMWVDANGDLAEADLPAAEAFELSAGRAVAFDGEVRRTPGWLAQANLEAELVEVEERLGELVSRFPALKAAPSPLPPGWQPPGASGPDA